MSRPEWERPTSAATLATIHAGVGIITGIDSNVTPAIARKMRGFLVEILCDNTKQCHPFSASTYAKLINKDATPKFSRSQHRLLIQYAFAHKRHRLIPVCRAGYDNLASYLANSRILADVYHLFGIDYKDYGDFGRTVPNGEFKIMSPRDSETVNTNHMNFINDVLAADPTKEPAGSEEEEEPAGSEEGEEEGGGSEEEEEEGGGSSPLPPPTPMTPPAADPRTWRNRLASAISRSKTSRAIVSDDDDEPTPPPATVKVEPQPPPATIDSSSDNDPSSSSSSDDSSDDDDDSLSLFALLVLAINR
jgi:hypothetical protein